MKRTAILVVVVACFVLSQPSSATGPMTCKDWHIDQNWTIDQIDIAYVEPINDNFKPIYEQLKARQVLEKLQEFLSPLRLPQKVLLTIEQCDQPIHPYQHGGPVTICYEYVDQLVKLAAEIPADATTARGVSRDNAIVGAFVQAALHETSHAIFDLQQIPVWGREEDAADKLAGFLMLQFGIEDARKLLNGAAYFFEASDRTWTGSDFSDVQSTEAQRFYNYLCMAYGANPAAFKDFVQAEGPQMTGSPAAKRSDLLPVRRAQQCPSEYADFKFGFDNFISPCLDQSLLKKVRNRTDWFQSTGGK